MRLLSIILTFVIFVCVFHAGPATATESQSFNLPDGTRDRSYLVYRPDNLVADKPAPLVIVLHGGFGSGAQAEKTYNWDAEADKHGFIVAYPDGVRHSWNAGGICCGAGYRDNVDDVGFITKLIAAVSKTENIDPKKVYLTGISNGAAMAYRYGCEGEYPVAAIGAVAGSLSFSCAKAHPVSVMEIHGMDDRNIPFTGGLGSKGVTKVSWLGVQQTLNIFRSADQCPSPASQKNGDVETSIANCAQGRVVTLITIDGAGHQWPGSKPKSGIVARMLGSDPPSTALDATPTLWAFFATQKAP